MGGSTPIWRGYYYDVKGRVTKTVENNLLSGYDITATAYTFTSKPATVKHTHTSNGTISRKEEYIYTYTYDHADRLKVVEHSLNGKKETLAYNDYDNQGRLGKKALHGSTTNQSTYAYNIRSWLTGITGTKFNQNLYYVDGVNTAKCYNGNISSMTWKAGDESAIRGYKFSYDGLSRLINAAYGETTTINTSLDHFTEKVSGYDKNGNITALQRYGQTTASAYGLIDNLSYTLNGNQLNRVDDAVTTSAYNNSFEFKDAVKQAAEYTYDANGNLTKDLNKGITGIQYNMLNLPSSITFSDGSTITYTYSADCTKLRTTHKIGTTTTTTDYCGNVIYENNIAKQLLTEEGYVSLSDNKYHYYLKDHQENNRVVINQTGAVEETNHYYPFGGVFAGTGNVQPYKYNGKEYDSKKGQNWYDYGARHYDAALGRFITNDRFAEKYNSMSTYQYGANNPMRNVDANGDSIVVLNHGEGAHMAMLIQNDAGKWQYFSVNGNNVYVSGKFFGGRKFNDIAVGEFNNPQKFLESSYNVAGDENDKSINSYGFSEGYIIPTSREQDEKIHTTFMEISQNEEYDVIGNNCTTVTQRSLEAAGLKTYNQNKRNYKVPANHSLGEGAFTVTHGNARPIVPYVSFNLIKKYNPQGKSIYRLKK